MKRKLLFYRKSPASAWSPLGRYHALMRLQRWHGWLVIGLTLAVFWPVLGFHFVSWDDPSNVLKNPLLNPVTLHSLGKIWSASYDAMYIPLTYTLWAGAAALGRMGVPGGGTVPDPAVFHALNLALHLAAALIVWRILAQLIGEGIAAVIGALLFAVHPVQVETVAWVSGLRDLLAGFLSLLALWRWMKLRQQDNWRDALIAVTALALALLSKPSAVVVPLMAAAIHLWRGERWTRRELQVLAIWGLMIVPCLFWTRALQPGGPQFGAPAPLVQRPHIALDALGFYLEKLVWPMHLGVEYGHSPALVISGNSWLWVMPIALLGAGLALGGRRRWLALVALFVAGLVPVLGLVPFNYQFYSTVADHYLYLSMLAVALAAAWLLTRQSGRVSILLALVLVALLGVRAFAQTWTWRNSQTLFAHNLQVNPRSFVSHLHLGQLLERQHVPAAAEAQFRAALEIKPDYSLARTELGLLLMHTGRVDEGLDQMLKSLHDARVEDPHADLSVVYRRIGTLLMQRGRTQEALRCLREAEKGPASRNSQ